jgi:hypothetical protein
MPGARRRTIADVRRAIFLGAASTSAPQFAFSCVPTVLAALKPSGSIAQKLQPIACAARDLIPEVARLAGVDRQLVRHWAMRAGINVTKARATRSARLGEAKLENVVHL